MEDPDSLVCKETMEHLEEEEHLDPKEVMEPLEIMGLKETRDSKECQVKLETMEMLVFQDYQDL